MGGKKRQNFFFPETHVYRELKSMEKNRLEKVRKHVFYKHTNIVIRKLAERNARKKFSKNSRIGYPKIFGKKSSGKSAKTRIFINTRISFQKHGGKKREKKFFPEKQVYRELKTMEKNRLEKVRKHVFYKHTNIVTKKSWEKHA